MALALADRIKETTTVTSTGPATLLGASVGYQSFGVIGNGNTTYYCIADQGGANWEVGIGTYTSAGTTLARTTVLKSSNAGALVSFPAGTKDVFVTYPSDTSVSGGGGGTYPTVQPTLNLDFANSKTVDPRITFVRNSTAAYYDGQTTAMAEQNLLLQSQFVGSWSSQQAPLTANSIVAPDGTSTAATITADGTANRHAIIQNLTTSAGTYTYSVYLKAGTNNYAQLLAGYSGVYANFDLSLGVVGTYGAGVTSTTITSVGSSWYRCSFTCTVVSSLTNVYVLISATASDVYYPSNSLATTIYAWGAQLEQRSTATAYTPTTTTPITNYIPVLMTAPAGVPRLDYNPTTGQALGLLIEEQRTNLLTYSNNFPAGYVSTPANLTVSPNSVIAPDGSQTATLFASSGTNSFNFSSTYIVPNGAVCGESIHIKDFSGLTKSTTYSFGRTDTSGTQTNVIIAVTSSGAMSISSTTNTGVSAYSSSLTAIGNGWYRLFCSYIPDNNGSDFGVVGSESIAFWGRQYEQQGQIIRTNTLGTGSTTTSIVLDVGATSGISTGNLICIVGYKAALITAYNSATQTATVAGLVVAGTTTPSLAAGAAYTVSVNTTGFATSYIPTVASTVTRAADVASMTGTNFSSWYNQSQGTVCVNYDFNATSGISANTGIFALNNNNTGSLLNRLDIRYSNPSNTSNGVALNVPNVGTMLTGGNLNKIASSYSVASSIFASNYGTASSYSLTVMPNPITQLVLGVTGSADSPLNGHIKKLSYYPVALSSSNLVALTS